MKISDCQYINLPIDLLEYSYSKGYIKALSIYLYLKTKSSGILNESVIDFADLNKQTGIRDKRTFKKHIKVLQELNWVGYNKASGNYFIRGLNFLGGAYQYNNKKAVRLYKKDIKTVKSFIEATVISRSVRGQKYATERAIIKQQGKAALKNGRAIQAYRLQKGYPLYYGLSNEKIAKLLKISKSHGNRAKLNAVNNGYIKACKMEEEIAILSKADYTIRYSLYNPVMLTTNPAIVTTLC